MNKLPQYEIYRKNFLEKIENLKSDFKYVNVDIASNEAVKVTISNTANPEKILILTSGIHGIEGYVCSHFIERFLEKQLYEINLDLYQVVIINFINVWGMKYYRRTDAQNIDLNRNFMDAFPNHIMTNKKISKLAKNVKSIYHWQFLLAFISIKLSGKDISSIISGQYKYPNWLFYGGEEITQTNRQLLEWLNGYISSEKQMILLDFHSGIGGTSDVTFILDEFCLGDAKRWKYRFLHPHVIKNNRIPYKGDFIHYLYQNRENNLDFYTTVEFGIKPNIVIARIFSFINLLIENNMYHNQNKNSMAFFYDYFPRYNRWWRNASDQYDKAMRGVLKYFTLLKSSADEIKEDVSNSKSI